MGRYARKKGKNASQKGIGKRGGKTKTKTRDLDQIKQDLITNKDLVEVLETAISQDNVSDHYCVQCARFFQSDEILTKHTTSKAHKQRVKKLKDWPTLENVY